jgi:hypothetical protein
MSVGIGASGFIGVALETVSGTYEPPTKYFPIDSESLKHMQATTWRTPIRQTADRIGAVAGDVHVEGDLSMDAMDDVVPYFLQCARCTMVKSGTTPNFIYTFTPTPAAVPTKTMSITIVRNGQVFGYTGCVVGSYTFTIDGGALKFQPSIVGNDEDTDTLPTPTFTETLPYGAGMYDVQIPTATQVFDADKFDFKVDDNATPNYRLKNTGRGAQFISFGERTVEVDIDRDFQDRVEYESYKTLTKKGLTLVASLGANNSITLNAVGAIIDTYDVALGGQGDLVRASIVYQGIADTGGAAYGIIVKTQEVFA